MIEGGVFVITFGRGVEVRRRQMIKASALNGLWMWSPIPRETPGLKLPSREAEGGPAPSGSSRCTWGPCGARVWDGLN